MVTPSLKPELKEYFDKLELQGIKLTDPQKWWYSAKKELLGEFILREFPSTPEEAFQASQEGYWYASDIKELYDAGRITNVACDKSIPVNCSWDLGQSDMCAIWFFQINRSGDINIIDFWQKNNTPLQQIAIMLKAKGYLYGTHLWPHDANARDRAGITFVQQARPLGLTGVVLESHGLLDGISLVKTTLSKCWFDKTKCAEGLNMLETYSKKWSNTIGGWMADPLHNQAAHASDSFRYLAAGIKRVSGSTKTGEADSSALRKFWG